MSDVEKVPVPFLSKTVGSHLSPVETAAIKKDISKMWKFELLHLFAKVVESAALEQDLGKHNRILQRAELISDEILLRMKK